MTWEVQKRLLSIYLVPWAATGVSGCLWYVRWMPWPAASVPANLPTRSRPRSDAVNGVRTHPHPLPNVDTIPHFSLMSPVRAVAYADSLNSLLYVTTPDTPCMAFASKIKTMNTASDTLSHWHLSPCAEARSNPKRG